MLKKLICLFSILSLCMAGTACSKSSDNNGKDKSYSYTVKVILGGKTLKEYTIQDFKKLPTSKIEVEGKTEDGPTLLSLLTDSKVQSFSKVTLKGIDNSSYVLTKDMINENTLLDITNHDTVKLASKLVPKDKWIKDIVEITVEE